MCLQLWFIPGSFLEAARGLAQPWCSRGLATSLESRRRDSRSSVRGDAPPTLPQKEGVCRNAKNSAGLQLELGMRGYRTLEKR